MEIERANFPRPWTREAFEAELGRGSLWVAEAEGRLAGYVAFWDFGLWLYIANVAVHPGMRRRGIGRALVKFVMEEAVKKGRRGVSLDVRISNAPARRLYESLGFKPARLNRRFYGDEDGMTYLWLRKP